MTNFRIHRFSLQVVGLALSTGLWIGPAHAQLYQFFPRTGSINWEQQVVIAFGEGRASPDTPPGEHRNEARERALEQAGKNLATLIQQINIDGNHRNRDIIEKHVVLQTELNRLVQTAQVLDTRFGSSGLAEVSLVLSLNTIAGWIGSVIEDSIAAGGPFPRPPVQSGDISNDKAEAGTSLTGVIVDARGIALEPALFPLILNESREVLYSSRWHQSQYLSAYRAMPFVQQMRTARRWPQISGNPLAIRAKASLGKFNANIVLDSAGSDTLRIILKRNPRILHEGKIVILVD